MEPVSDRNFTIIDPAGMSTMAFLVNDPEDGTDYCTLKKLDYTLQDPDNIAKKTFVLESDKAKDVIVLLTLNSEKAFLNSAVVADNKFLISKEPTKVGFKVIFNEEQTEFRDFKYTPNFRRPISIIDPEIPDELRPKLYYDEDANMVKARLNLEANKEYLLLEVKDKEIM